MASKTDLHTHSTYSDGRLTPTELVNLAAKRGVTYLALTDHDITDGITEAEAAASKHHGMTVIPGIEISTDVPGNEVHILGYFLEWTGPEFQMALATFRSSRLDRGQRMVERLKEIGAPVSWERVKEIAGIGAVGRPHIAQALVEARHVASIKEAFDRYISRNGPAYVERERMSPAQAVELIAGVKGLPVLAHPRELDKLDELLAELKPAGLIGMEVYYKDYSPGEINRLLTISKRHGLLPLGGSDYHGLGGTGEREPGDIPLPQEAADRLLELARRKNRT